MRGRGLGPKDSDGAYGVGWGGAKVRQGQVGAGPRRAKKRMGGAEPSLDQEGG